MILLLENPSEDLLILTAEINLKIRDDRLEQQYRTSTKKIEDERSFIVVAAFMRLITRLNLQSRIKEKD